MFSRAEVSGSCSSVSALSVQHIWNRSITNITSIIVNNITRFFVRGWYHFLTKIWGNRLQSCNVVRKNLTWLNQSFFGHFCIPDRFEHWFGVFLWFQIESMSWALTITWHTFWLHGLTFQFWLITKIFRVRWCSDNFPFTFFWLQY